MTSMTSIAGVVNPTAPAIVFILLAPIDASRWNALCPHTEQV